MTEIQKLRSALRLARKTLADERLEKVYAFTRSPHAGPRVKPPYPGMFPAGRSTLRRFDRALDKIDEALG